MQRWPSERNLDEIKKWLVEKKEEEPQGNDEERDVGFTATGHADHDDGELTPTWGVIQAPESKKRRLRSPALLRPVARQPAAPSTPPRRGHEPHCTTPLRERARARIGP
jgi:hypothetical protein